MSNNIENRQMPIFLSSTFQDIQGEREELIKRIFPKLRFLAEQRLVTLTPIDLRWGITKEEAQTGKVIELCLHEIERCQPFFIGIIGDRYGWCPSMMDIRDNSMLFDQYEWLQEDIANGLSITEIEMQFAVLRRQYHTNAFFFIKNSNLENCTEDIKKHKLINSIKAKGQEISAVMASTTDNFSSNQCYYAYYDSPSELGLLVENALIKLLDAIFPIGEDDEWSREKRAQQAYLQNLCDIYVPQAGNELNTYFMDSMKFRYMMITSAQKCLYGKSAFVANWLKIHQNDISHNYIYHFIGVGNLGSNYKTILKRLCIEVSSLYGLDSHIYDDKNIKQNYSSTLSELLRKIKDEKPLFIVIDGLQHLSDFDGSKMLEWLPVIPENVSLIVTAPYHDATRDVFYRRYDNSSFDSIGSVSFLESFDKDEERQFAEEYLSKFGKRLSPTQTDTVLSAYSSAKLSPNGVKDILTLKSLLNELVIFGSYELLDDQIAYYCEDNLTHFYSRMFERMEKDYGLETVSNILCLIAYSRAGLSEPEILEISNATIMQWSYIHYAIPHLLTLRDGKYYIDKFTIATTIAKRYGNNEKTIRQMIVNHFNHSSDYRAVEELLFQYYHLQEFKSLYKSLLNIDVFSHLYNKSGLAELHPYWTALYDSRKGFSVGDYIDLQVSPTEENAKSFADLGQFAEAALGDKKSAKSLYTKSKEIYESILHNDYDTLASVYGALKMFDKALESIDKIIPIAELMHEKNDSYFYGLLLSKGIFLYRLDEKAQAIEMWNKVLGEIDANNLQCVTVVVDAYFRLSSNSLLQGDVEHFKENIENAIKVINENFGEYHAYLGDAYYRYGLYHERAKHEVEAISFYEKALDIFTKWYPKNHERIVDVQKRIYRLRSKKKSLMESINNSIDNLLDWLKETPKEDSDKHLLSKKEFKDVLNFFEGITDDLYLVDEGWEDGMKEHVYAFKYKHDCYIGDIRYVFDSDDKHVYIYVDASGMYNSCGKTFDNLKDAQVHYLMRGYTFYEQYCDHKNI